MDTPPPTDETPVASQDENLRRTMSWVAVVLVTIFAIAALSRVVYLAFAERSFFDIAQKQLPAVVGVPLSAVASLFVVLVLRMSSGPIEIELRKLKFKGAAAPIVFWLACFLGIAGAIKMLWLPA
jgi:hypothetical protein